MTQCRIQAGESSRQSANVGTTSEKKKITNKNKGLLTALIQAQVMPKAASWRAHRAPSFMWSTSAAEMIAERKTNQFIRCRNFVK